MSDPPKLSEELLNVGWKVVYSKRKKKWYYFNKKTNMSLWSMPKLGDELSKVEQSSCPALNAAPNAVPGLSKEQAISKKTHPSSHSTQQTENSPAFLSFLQNLTGPSADNRDETTNVPIVNDKAGTLPKSTLDSVSEVINGLKSTSTPPEQREYLLQKGIAMSIELQNTVTLDYGERLEIVNSLIDVVEENSHDPLVNSKNLPPEVEDDVLDEFAVNTLDEMFDQTAEGSKSKIKVLKKQLKTVKALHEKKTPHTDKSFPKMSAGLLNSLQQLHASVLTDIDASKANHGGIHSPEVDKFDSKTKPWMRRVKKSSNHSSEPSHGINVPVLKPPEELSKATSSNASTDPSTPSDSGQKSEQDASEADICSTPSSDVKPSPMDVKSSPADIKASPAEIKASPAESKSSLDCKTSDSLKSPYDEKGSEESDGKKQFDKNSRFNLWTSPESSRRMDPRAHSYRNRGNFLQGTTSSSESPYKGSPVMSQYKIENKPPIKHPKPWHVRPSLFDKIISNKTPANREEETEPKFFSPLSKLDETPTTYGAYKRQFQSAQKEKQQKANNNVMMKPWLDVTNNQHGEQVKSPLYPPLAKKTISAPTLDRKQGSYVEKTVEQMLKSYQNQKEMHNYRIPKRVQRDKKSVEISGAHGTKDDTPHDRHRRVSNTEECDTMSSAPSDYDTMSTCSEMPGKTHPTIDSDTDSQVGGSSVLSDDSTTKTKKNRPVRKLNWGPKSKRINTVEKDQSDPEECTPDSTTSLTTAPQQPMKPLSEMPPLRPLAPALGKPQNQQEQDKKNVYENWMLENKAWIMAKIENLRQNLKQLNSKLETVTQKERDGEMEGPDFKFHLSRLLFDISNATEQIEQYEVIAEKHQKRIKGYITLQKICRQKINPQIKIEGRAPLSWKTAESEKMKEEGAGDNEVSSTTNGTQKEEESSKSDKVMRVINGCEVELDVAEDPFEWMYDDDDLVLQVSRFKVKSEPGQGDDAEETPVLQLGEAEGGGFGTCADIEKVKPEPFADDATIGETDSTMLLNIEQTAAISMEQWQEGIVIKQEPTEDQLPIISAQTLSMEQWESGDVPSVSEEESSGLQLVATTAEPMSLEQWNATEDESSKTEDKPQILEAEAISVEKFEESKDETLKNAEDGKIVEPAKDTVKLSSPKLSEQTTKTESEPTKDDDCFPGASDVDMRMDYHPESLLSNLGYSGNAKDYSFNRIEKTKISLPMSDPALLHVHNCYLTVEDHLNKKNIPSAYTHLRQNNWPCPPLGCSNEIQYRTFRVRLLRRMMWDILMLTKSSSNESIASKTYHLTIAADVLKKVLVTRKRDLEIAGHEAAIMNLNQIFEAVVDRLTMVKQNQLSYRLFTYIQSFPSLQLTLSLGVLHRLIEAMYNEKSLDMDVLQNLFTTVSDRGLYPPQVSTPSVTQLRTIILLRQFNQADIFLVIHHYFKEMFKSLITHVHKGAPLPITAYQVSVCMVDNSTMSHQMRDVFRETMDKKKIFITLSKVLEQLKPSIAIYPSQDAVYKLDSDNVRSHLFMQALREVGARILEPHRHGQDYTVKQARVLFGSVLMAEPTPPAQPAQPIPKSPIKIQNISGVKTVIQSSPSAIPVVNIAGIVKLDTKQFKGDVKNEIKKEQSTQPPIDDSKPSISSLLAAEEVLNMRSSALNEPRPEPIDPYNVNEPEVTKHTKRPRRGNHTFSYRSGRHPDNKHSYRPDDYEDSDGNIYLSSPDSIHSDIFHIPYNIKYQMEEYDGCEDGYFQGREILMIQEAINATRHETTIHYDYEQDDDQDSYDARHYQGLYDHEERPSERGNYESMEYEGMEYDRPNMAYAAMKYDDDQRRYDSSSRYEDPAYDVYRDNDMRTSTLEPTEAVYGRPRRMHPLEDRKRKAPLLPTIPAKRKPPYM